MSLSGDLAHVSVADVMQFIHLGGRTGTLSLACDDRAGRISFHRGRIIHAWTPERTNIGDLLLAGGLLDRAGLEAALGTQRQERPRRALGRILVASGRITEQDLKRVLLEQVERDVYDLAVWSRGTFTFAVDDLSPIDDFGVEPEQIAPLMDLNTQMVLLEAMRLFDERTRNGRPGVPAEGTNAPPAPSRLGPRTPAPAPQPAPLPGPAVAASLSPGREALPPVRLLTADKGLQGAIARLLPGEVTGPLLAPGRAAGPTVLALDLRGRRLGREAIETARVEQGAAAVVGIGAQAPEAAAELGLSCLVPPAAEPVARAVSALRQVVARALGPSWQPGPELARLRQVVDDLRTGLVSATASLQLMSLISESFERAVLFVARPEGLLALGAFGLDRRGTSLAEVARGLKITALRGGILGDAIRTARAHRRPFADAGLPEALARLLGPPGSGDVVVFPVVGQQRVVLVIYADNGARPLVPDGLDVIELAAAQVGLAFENELLRRQLESTQQRPKAMWPSA